MDFIIHGPLGNTEFPVDTMINMYGAPFDIRQLADEEEAPGAVFCPPTTVNNFLINCINNKARELLGEVRDGPKSLLLRLHLGPMDQDQYTLIVVDHAYVQIDSARKALAGSGKHVVKKLKELLVEDPEAEEIRIASLDYFTAKHGVRNANQYPGLRDLFAHANDVVTHCDSLIGAFDSLSGSWPHEDNGVQKIVDTIRGFDLHGKLKYLYEALEPLNVDPRKTRIATKTNFVEQKLRTLCTKERTAFDVIDLTDSLLMAIELLDDWLKTCGFWTMKMCSHHFNPVTLEMVTQRWIDTTLSNYNQIYKVTQNTAVIGAAIESQVRTMIKQAVGEYSVSSGTVWGMVSDPQIDGIIWYRKLGAPLYENGDVVVLPLKLIRGVFEVKATCSNIEDFYHRMISFQAQFEAILLKQGFGGDVPPLIGVVVVTEKGESEQLYRGKNVVVSLFREKDGEFVPNKLGWRAFVQYIYEEVLETEQPYEDR